MISRRSFLYGTTALAAAAVLPALPALPEKKRPRLVWDFTKTPPPALVCIRPSWGSYYDSKGIMRVAAPNVPRFDHDPVTLKPLGLKIGPDERIVSAPV